jgi:hypothetical protein
MIAHRCCKGGSNDSGPRAIVVRAADDNSPPPTFIRRCAEFAGSAVPGAILVLLPKCPACLAAYIAIGTGVGLSIPAATHLRMLLVILCVASLAYFAARPVGRFIALIFTAKKMKSNSPRRKHSRSITSAEFAHRHAAVSGGEPT